MKKQNLLAALPIFVDSANNNYQTLHYTRDILEMFISMKFPKTAHMTTAIINWQIARFLKL